MVKVDMSTIVNAPIGRVWTVLRDFNGHDSWHPAIAESHMESGRSSDTVGAVRNFRLKDGSVLREQLLELSDPDRTFSYCLLDTPIPLFNYVAHVTLKEVTDGNRTFWHWKSSFNTPEGQEEDLKKTVSKNIYGEGFAAIKRLVEHG